MNVLVLNAGSSSLKFSLLDAATEQLLADGYADWAGAPTRYAVQVGDGSEYVAEVAWKRQADAVGQALRDLHGLRVDAVGHRVVHGGAAFTRSVRLTPEVKKELARLAELAPLHNPPSLEAIAAAEPLLRGVPHVAAFDTAFHATLPPEAQVYPLPYAWFEQWGIRRYGFHGLSHAYCAGRAAELLQRPAEELKLVICHLGHGCSASAVRGGRCVETTMGFTPLEGLMMGTRSGSVDPGVLLHVLRRHGLTADRLDAALNRESGLLGVSGVSADLREVLAAAAAGSERATLALAIYARRVKQAVGALAATLGGADALVFTAGVGEHASAVRESVCDGLAAFGLALDPEANAACQPDADIAAASSPGRILVVTSREDLMIVREVARVLGPGG